MGMSSGQEQGCAGVSQGIHSQGGPGTHRLRHTDTLKCHQGPGPVSKAAQH